MQDGTDSDDITKSVAVGNDGSIFLAGYTEGDWSQPNEGEQDFAITKLSSDGELVWRWQVMRTARNRRGYSRIRRVVLAGDVQRTR